MMKRFFLPAAMAASTAVVVALIVLNDGDGAGAIEDVFGDIAHKIVHGSGGRGGGSGLGADLAEPECGTFVGIGRRCDAVGGELGEGIRVPGLGILAVDAGEEEVGGEECALVGEFHALVGHFAGVILLGAPGQALRARRCFSAQIPDIFGKAGRGFEPVVSRLPFVGSGKAATQEAGGEHGGPGREKLHRMIGRGRFGLEVFRIVGLPDHLGGGFGEPGSVEGEFFVGDFPGARAEVSPDIVGLTQGTLNQWAWALVLPALSRSGNLPELLSVSMKIPTEVSVVQRKMVFWVPASMTCMRTKVSE